YQTVYDSIASGKLPIGTKIPSEKELGEKFHVSRITVKTGLNMLVEQGLIKRRRGSGTFVLNTPSQAKSSKEHGTIGVIISGLSDSYGKNLLITICDECDRKGYSVMLKISHEDQQLERKYLKELLDEHVKGILILPVQKEFYNELLVSLLFSDFPVVIIDRKLKNIRSTVVGVDNVGAAKEAANFLFSHGHRRIALLTQSNMHNSAIIDRIIGLRESYALNGVLLDQSLWIENLISDYSEQSGSAEIEADVSAIMEKLNNHPDITCLLSLDNHCATLAIEALRRMRKTIPEDCSLFSFDTPKNIIASNNVSHIAQQEELIAQNSVQALLATVEVEEAVPNEIVVPTLLEDLGTVKDLSDQRGSR
ncbi:GntR family transcriptional regulator, partial [Bifidobacterium aquikefiri]|uniref:GntR family transcriptional regulator n=1 Tax=Bifidobacterium aquikefiri TaxID=1653207 RepID=UPI0039EAA700